MNRRSVLPAELYALIEQTPGNAALLYLRAFSPEWQPYYRKPEEKKPEEKPDYYYVRLEGEKAVARVPAPRVKPLLDVVANPDPLRSRDLVSTAGTTNSSFTFSA